MLFDNASYETFSTIPNKLLTLSKIFQMYWRSRNLSALYVWLFGPFTPVNSRVTRGDTVQQAIEKMQGQLDAAGVGLDETVTEESSNAVKSSGIWTWVKGLFTTHTTEANAHPSSAISHGSGSVEGRLDNITDGVITKDFDDNIISITTFGETTTFNRDVSGNIESWENDTHIWNLTKENGEITGWTLTEKP